MAEAGRTALGLRYQLLPYLYTAFRHTAGHGCPLARPLFFGWPQDATARDVDHQWLMGDSLLITPVLDEVRSSQTECFSACFLLQGEDQELNDVKAAYPFKGGISASES